MLARDLLRLVSAHPARRNASRLPQTLHPSDRRADPDAKPRRRLMPRQVVLLESLCMPIDLVDRILRMMRLRDVVLLERLCMTIDLLGLRMPMRRIGLMVAITIISRMGI